jgi:chromosome segregation protein
MLLKSIEINGFKSFAKKSELFFNSSISAIVGPNGSGKSNVAEAFRFVLGEQSIKSLRGKRGEDLIWNGSNEVLRAGKASVKVLFDNKNKFLPVDFAEVSVERVVHRDGLNEYFLNGSRVRLKDIVELLSSAHIGSSGHHIISQGEADRILNASLKERKEIIEEALGLKIYEYKKVESQKKLISTRENIEKAESLKRELTPHLKFLKKQVDKIEKAHEIKTELVLKSRKYLSAENRFIKSQSLGIEKIKKPLLDSLQNVRQSVSDAKKVLESSSNKDSFSQELIDLEKKIEKIRENKDLINRKIGMIDGEIFVVSKNIEKQQELSKSNDLKTVPIVAIKELYKEIAVHMESMEKTKDFSVVLNSVNAIKSIFSAFVDLHQDRIDSNFILEYKSELENLSIEKTNILKQKELVDIEEKEAMNAYLGLKNKIEQEKDVNRDAEKNLFRALADESNILNQIKEVEIEESVLNQKIESFRRDSSELIAILGQELLGFENDFTEEGYNKINQEEDRRHIEKMKIRFEESGAVGGDDIQKEYNDVNGRIEFLEKEILDLQTSASSLEALIDELDQKLNEDFKIGMDKINSQFTNFFALMFGGGFASLSIVKKVQNKKNLLENLPDEGGEILEEKEEEQGIDIDVSLPRKKVKGLIQLSGGERALTSIALLFAMSQVNPPPFIILDETDAALDEANSRKYGDMIENLSKFSQLIVITHNRETMSRAGSLYGITMGSGGVSKLLSVSFEDAVVVAK